jgi:two-component system, OmpR family, sensor histidine kinase TctE
MKLFQREQRSLFGEILDWMLTPLLLLWPISLGLTWLVAQSIANKPFDRALEYNVRALAQLVSLQGNKLQFNLPAPAREILRADDADLVYYQVLGLRGELLSGERDLPPPDDDASPSGPDEVRLRDAELRGLEVRVASIWVRFGPPGAAASAGAPAPPPRPAARWYRWPKPAKNAQPWPRKSSRA